MCGICGQMNFEDTAPVRRSDLGQMVSTIVHRGPDDEGFFLDGNLGLGFRRLSIIDLGGGHQPMSDQDESVWVVFNGEIYNFPELRRELEGHGHVFRSASDTEVIIHGYKQWGQGVLSRLNGMFGLAIWDVKKRKLTVARDPFGIKLIYYKIDHGRLYFGSELRPLLACEDTKPEIDPDALNLFLRYRYTPSPYTLYKGIFKLAPGTMLTCEAGSCKVERWYNYSPKPFPSAKAAAEAQEELTDLYKQAMKRHLLSDVPVGLLLSGGVDSTLLLALMNLYGKGWHTYTVGYGEQFADDELADAARTAKMFGADHHSVLLSRNEFEDALPKIVSHLEEPIASSSVVPMYFVCQRARQDVKVALMGQGPDELFGGYRRHLGVRYGPLWSRIPAPARNLMASGISSLPRNETLKRGIHALGIEDPLKRYQNVLSLLPGEKIDGLFQEGVLGVGAGNKILGCWEDIAQLSEGLEDLGRFSFIELRSTLPDELLMYADKLSMAHSLEVRVPFLDREVVEYVERLPASLKVRNGGGKWLHREVCKQMLPQEVLRRKKRGFAVNVVDDWFNGAVGGKLEDLLLDSSSLIYQYLRPSVVGQLLDEHRSRTNDNHKVLFSLVMLEEWMRGAASLAQKN